MDMEKIRLPAASRLVLSRVLAALSDPTRLEIVRIIHARGGEIACCELGLNQPKATLSHHFKVLREAGVIRVRNHGTQHLNSLRTAELERRFPGLMRAILREMESRRPRSRKA